jgi:hypothetical protein
MTACVKRGLKVDAAYGGMLDGEINDLADFVLIHAALDRWN